jgi:hypothetical protein
MDLYDRVVKKVMFDTVKHDLDNYHSLSPYEKVEYTEAKINSLTNTQLLYMISLSLDQMREEENR